MIRAWHDGTILVGDAGYFVARSRDVLTAHHPYVGAFSSGTAGTAATVNNLGPLQLDLLAPFTKLSPYWGAILGAGLINIASVVGVWLAARRVLGTIGVVGAMLATVVLEAAMGSTFLVDTRQQTALLLPFWCLLWLAAILAAGVWWAMPWAAFVSSVLVQTHFSYVYLVAVIAAAAVAAAIWLSRDGLTDTRWRRATAVTAVVLVLCWAQTVWDQMFGTGNLGRVFGVADSDGLGTRDGRPHRRRVGARAAVLDAGRDPALPPRRLVQPADDRHALGARSHRRLGGGRGGDVRRRSPSQPRRTRRDGADGLRRSRCGMVVGDPPPEHTDRCPSPELLLDVADRRVPHDSCRRRRDMVLQPRLGAP